MAKKRTGLQSEIAGIFSGVPVPKKGGPRSKHDNPSYKADEEVSKPSGSVIPKPVTPLPQIPMSPTPIKPVEPLPVAPRPKVTEIKVPEQRTKQIPPKISRRRKNKVFGPKAGVNSSRQKTSIILFVLFSTALVIVLARPYFTPRRNVTKSGKAGQASTGSSLMANIEINWPMPTVYSADIRDPMELGSRQQIRIETPVELIVKGITYSEDRKFAVIGTQTMQEGDTILGATIVEINPNNVVFERDGERWTQEVEGDN